MAMCRAADRTALWTFLSSPGDRRPGYNAQVFNLGNYSTGAVIETILDLPGSYQPDFRAVRNRLW